MIAWIVWELRVGRIMVRGCPVQRQACIGADGKPYTSAILYILEPTTWQWTDATAIDQSNAEKVKWSADRFDVSHPPDPKGTRVPWRLRSPTFYQKKKEEREEAERLSARPRKLTSGSPPTATAPSRGIRLGNVLTKSIPPKPT